MTKTQLIKALREIIENPDDIQQWEKGPHNETWIENVKVVRVERLEALLDPPPTVTLEGDRDGDTIDPEVDFDRLNDQMKLVWSVVRTGRWYSLNELAELTGCPTPSVSARLRDLRKEKFGSQEVQSKRVEGGFWVYRVVRSGA